MEQGVWQTEPGGVLACELGGLRLAVQQVNTWMRYTVHRRADGSVASGPALLASGSKDDVRAAMMVAESVAAGHAVVAPARNAGAGRYGPVGGHAA